MGLTVDVCVRGRAKYIGFNRMGDLIWVTQEGFPW
jgi:hypothetical protein